MPLSDRLLIDDYAKKALEFTAPMLKYHLAKICLIYGAKALPLIKLPIVLAVIFICLRGLAGTTVL